MTGVTMDDLYKMTDDELAVQIRKLKAEQTEAVSKELNETAIDRIRLEFGEKLMVYYSEQANRKLEAEIKRRNANDGTVGSDN